MLLVLGVISALLPLLFLLPAQARIGFLMGYISAIAISLLLFSLFETICSGGCTKLDVA